ncbi:NAD(P)/FAD-dependent oxidoreductase [Flammeovirga kamogawensis]|uniref:NADH:ubiquinone reductase (non-electrogenic) n=1 Tax=Flammeovirga kamogawensis TaxID=373891 RepID=A0ABX8GYY8_9BACT|nr:NAD(P)/FAD-dependent oxidoreductase [Flammeovirga kamogawensis]MBB6459273.1 NADH dehydrogenase [Flammeovirga kamogawensis]QWG08833.1 NAD(P)/FAD-dependent oxidoreductase [Flammeovirga kamogawensis]TRX67123.1 NAD(P)/FAD-dependent oxidoreductase [Flammeovirga kamogawensis]
MEKHLDVPEPQVPRVVIVGGGFGGLELVKQLKKVDVQTVLLDRNNYHTFQPLLYQVATAGLEPDSISFPIRKLFHGFKNFFFRLAVVKEIDTSKNEVITDIGSLKYDYLVVASGSRTNFFGNENIRYHSMPLKTVVQSLQFRSFLLQNFEKALQTNDLKLREAYMTFVIVGGGPTGVELAGALSELKRYVLPVDYPELDVRRMTVHLVDAGDRVLQALSKKSSVDAEKYLIKLGVQLHKHTLVKDYDGKVALTVKNGADGEIFTKNLIWSAGVEGNSPKGIDIDKITERGNRIKVDDYNKVIGTENVFAIGDVASMEQEEYPHGHPMVAPVAIQQATNLGKNIKSILKDKDLKTFKYINKGSMATVGKNKAVVEVGNFKSSGAFAWFIWMFVHIMSLIGMQNKSIVFVNWFWNYLNYDRSNRLIINRFSKTERKQKRDEGKAGIVI